jgi:cysteine desulfurase
MTPPVYLDYNATTPVAPEVADAIRPFLYESFRQPVVVACIWATG